MNIRVIFSVRLKIKRSLFDNVLNKECKSKNFELWHWRLVIIGNKHDFLFILTYTEVLKMKHNRL